MFFEEPKMLKRRSFLAGLGAAGLTAQLPRPLRAARQPGPLTKAIPSSGERIPVIGMGTWQTFDVGDDAAALAQRVRVLRAFFQAGGGMIDSSPMYGTSEAVMGHCLQHIGGKPPMFSATKVWTPGKDHGVRQMAESERLWRLKTFDLMQIHNLLGWEGHLETLKQWKAEGRIRYLGITTSHGRRHGDLARIMESQPLDFVQLTYNPMDREAEDRLLPMAKERGIAVIVNRPFQRGALIDRLEGRPLPPWAGDFEIHNWAQFLLKFVVSHPAVTCAIPATRQVEHMKENMAAAHGPMPDAKMRAKMAAYVAGL